MLHKSLGYAIVGDVYLETCNMYPLCTLSTPHTLMTCGREYATMMTTFQSKDGTGSLTMVHKKYSNSIFCCKTHSFHFNQNCKDHHTPFPLFEFNNHLFITLSDSTKPQMFSFIKKVLSLS
jgi:hypothetical protein